MTIENATRMWQSFVANANYVLGGMNTELQGDNMFLVEGRIFIIVSRKKCVGIM